MSRPFLRDHAVDALRILAVALLVPFHVNLAFSYEGFHVTDPQRSHVFDYACRFIYAWHMPLLMLLAGMSALYSLRKRTRRQFVTERVRRILVPLAFGMLLIVPPQTWLERVQDGEFSGGLLAFWPTVFTTGVYPEGNLTWNHLWFLAYLFVIALVTLPLLRRWHARAPLPALDRFANARGVLLIAPLILFATQCALRPVWMHDTQNFYWDYANLAQDTCFFLAGALLAASPALAAALDRHGLHALLLGLATMTVHLTLPLLFPHGPPAWAPPPVPFLVTGGVRFFNTWFWVVAVVAGGRAVFRSRAAWIDRTSGLAYPFYVWHQTVIVVLVFLAAPIRIPLWPKWALLVLLSGAVTFLLTFATARIPGLRAVFGIAAPRPRPPQAVPAIER